MKKIIEEFVCDDCGKPLPAEFIGRNSLAETNEFITSRYNRVSVNPSLWDHCEIRFSLSVSSEYRNDLVELCPECRLKWLKLLVAQLEKEQN